MTVLADDKSIEKKDKTPASPCSSTSRALRICLLTRSSCSTLAKVRSRLLVYTKGHRRWRPAAPLLLPRSPDSSPMGRSTALRPLAQAADVFSASHHRHSGKSWPCRLFCSPCSLLLETLPGTGFRLFRPDATIPLASIFPLWRPYSMRTHYARPLFLSLLVSSLLLAACCFAQAPLEPLNSPRDHFLSHLARHAFRGCSQGQCSAEPLDDPDSAPMRSASSGPS